MITIQGIEAILRIFLTHSYNGPRRFPVGVLCPVGYLKVVIFGSHHHALWAYCLPGR
jgi:hypothetical protein